MGVYQQIQFIKGYLKEPKVVGALIPSSPALANALCRPYRRSNGPVRVLEVGAGTGAVTRRIGELLRNDDELHICEVCPRFADILEEKLLATPLFSSAMATGRVRMIRGPVQGIELENHYDFIISGLPFTVFTLEDVEDVFDTVRKSLKPGGIFSYFEYLWLRRFSCLTTLGRNGRRVRSVSAYLTKLIREHQFAARPVLLNLPPAWARYLRFDS